MGNQEETKHSKSEKSSSPATPEQTSAHAYPEWAAMQPYYGPRVALPPYYGAAVSPGHAPPPYMWGPPLMIPPYGAPYPAVYPHTGMYVHPTVPLASPSTAVENPKKPSERTESSLIKKLSSFDGLAMSIGNGNVDNGDAEADERTETELSTDGDRSGEEKSGKKRNSEGLNLTGDAKGEAKIPETGVAVDGPINGKLPPVRASSSFEVKNPASMDAKKVAANSAQPGPVVPSEVWLQTEREVRRERRKQSNRESARRSRLRKQAEAEELAWKVESLMEENMALKSEISRLTESLEKLRIENLSLMEKLGNVQRAEGVEAMGETKDEEPHPSDTTENLISRINDSSSLEGRNEVEGEAYERNSQKGTQLHQLLDSQPRTDALAAG